MAARARAPVSRCGPIGTGTAPSPRPTSNPNPNTEAVILNNLPSAVQKVEDRAGLSFAAYERSNGSKSRARMKPGAATNQKSMRHHPVPTR